ncbi:FAD-dependent oxidoreductase [Longirhabdus pacifica]|uniref:FAD-dependent oxidoreductase n=1 Tax=Longirhabdus pacifica TaxID=2305227 RepID=UPI0013E8C4EC|nr:FAD-dependent oxidoreductase [Longirhabdus pacifica]
MGSSPENRKKVVIVGGVAGGASAAARLRRLDEHAHIVMVEKGSYISFANCGLPYYIGETIANRSKLIVQTPELMEKRFRIDIRTESEVTSVDSEKKVVHVRDGENNSYEESYDILILSPGAKPIVPPLPGVTSDRILTLRNMKDTDNIKSYVDQEQTDSAIIVGGGYIGLEMAENLKQRGLKVTLIEAQSHVLSTFDPDMAAILDKKLIEENIELMTNERVASFTEQQDGVTATLSSGKTVKASLVILAVGVQPDTAFLADSSIALTDKGYIKVNEKLESSVEHVYAVGDAVSITFPQGESMAIALAGPANKQGRIVADVISGMPTTFKRFSKSSIVKLFDMTAASTGENEKSLQQAQIPYNKIFVHPPSHATYYPGASAMVIKLLFADDGKVLGAQAIGKDGVDKRIDTIATTIHFGGSVHDLAELDLTYAPPYSSAKDPVNLAGFVAQNALNGLSHYVEPTQLDDKDPSSSAIKLDVRTEAEFQRGHVDGALNIPVDALRERLDELDTSKPIHVYCQVGLRGHVASRILAQHGFNVKNVTGGYKSYTQGK